MRQSSVGVPRTSSSHHTTTLIMRLLVLTLMLLAASEAQVEFKTVNEILWYLHVKSEIPLTVLAHSVNQLTFKN